MKVKDQITQWWFNHVGYEWISKKDIVRRTGVARKTLDDWIADRVASGWLERKRVGRESHFRRTPKGNV